MIARASTEEKRIQVSTERNALIPAIPLAFENHGELGNFKVCRLGWTLLSDTDSLTRESGRLGPVTPNLEQGVEVSELP